MSSPASPSWNRNPRVILWIVALCALPEVLFTLTELPLFGLDGLRRTAIIHAAFWNGLLGDWEPIFVVQPATMFVTYAFLHSGLMHVLFNMLLTVHLGRDCVARLGERGFVLLWLVTAVGGGAGFALLSTSSGPMVGASGAVFGLFGATQFWDYQRRRAAGASLRPVGQMFLGLVLMNVILYVLVGGMLAWQAHLGGYVAGFLFAFLVTPTLGHRYRGFS